MSLKEASHYIALSQAEKAGKIQKLKLQPRFPIVIKGQKICTVVLDFTYYDNEKSCWFYIDVKGMDTSLSKLKRKLVETEYGITVTII